MTLSTPIEELKGVGEEVAKKLAVLGIKTVGDLITNYPRRYEDYSQITPIKDLSPGQVTLEATISQVTSRYVRRGLHITEAIASDSSGSVRLIWFNQPYRAAAIKRDTAYYIAGDFGLRRGRFGILNPSVELVSTFPVNTARIIPVYRETKGLKSFTIRKLIRQSLTDIGELREHLPLWLMKQQKLMGYSSAVMEMHFPSSADSLAKAKRRLGFEEVFELSLAALLNKYEMHKNKALAIVFHEKLAREFVAQLPFKLTDSQRLATWQILQDMAKSQPMNRLLEGDVGSGKTVVAAMAGLMALKQGFQVAFMAPTEILARQHEDSIHKLLRSVGYERHIGLLIGGLKPNQKTDVRKKIAVGNIGLIVGTHALISEQVDMHKLGLIIVDEQHRFGVAQRKKLQAKAGHMPHVLHMTATPIPRSLALTLYGELDISVLDEMPPTRKVVKTKVWSPNSRAQLNKLVDSQIEDGRQVFIVCPLISDSETSGGLSVEEVFERVSKREFKNRRVGLLHGHMKSAEKDALMRRFVAAEIDILVSTTVVEVGVDVANASVMVIEGAERFGLAQIHQLRGRVGRGDHQSYCYLIPSDSRRPNDRLAAMESLSDGFKLAEMDLQLRGPGAIYGTVQHGALDLRVASLADVKLIAAARSAAQAFIDKSEKLAAYPRLKDRVAVLRAITNLN